MGRTGTLRVGAARGVQTAAVTRGPAAAAKRQARADSFVVRAPLFSQKGEVLTCSLNTSRNSWAFWHPWLQDRHEKPYGVTVSGQQTEMSFMVKDSKRFPDTNGWWYATFAYDASSDTFKPATTNPSFARGCHTANAKANDFVFTDYAKR
jgi:hypothetical protein